MIKEIIGNFTALTLCGNFDVICCYTNCFCDMNIGEESTKQIKNLFPIIYKIDMLTNKGDIYKLGEISTYYIKERKLRIFNFYIKYNIKDNIEYTALALCIRNMINFLEQDKEFRNCYRRIALPSISSLSGDYNQIKKIITQELSDYNVSLIKDN